MLEFIAVAILLMAEGALGGWISTQIRENGFGWYFVFLSGNLSVFVWAYLAKYSKMNLATASILFDLLFNISWFVMIAYLGIKFNTVQAIGIGLIILGIAFLGYQR
jgi:hypothetical protein